MGEDNLFSDEEVRIHGSQKQCHRRRRFSSSKPRTFPSWVSSIAAKDACLCLYPHVLFQFTNSRSTTLAPSDGARVDGRYAKLVPVTPVRGRVARWDRRPGVAS